MAQTYTLTSVNTLFAANKCLLGLYNATGSGRVVRVYRVWILNNQIISVTGAMTSIELRKITAGSGGTTITPYKHDSTNESFPAQITVATNMTFTPTDVYTRFIWSTDEPINTASPAAAITIDEYEVFPPYCCVWDVAYGDSNVEPIVLREGYGLALVNIGATTGQCDVFFEVTLAST
jgi:hypothetical protein